MHLQEPHLALEGREQGSKLPPPEEQPPPAPPPWEQDREGYCAGYLDTWSLRRGAKGAERCAQWLTTDAEWGALACGGIERACRTDWAQHNCAGACCRALGPKFTTNLFEVGVM